MPILKRLALPLVLAAACVAAWLTSAWLGDMSVPLAQGDAVETLDTPIASVARLPRVATTSLEGQRQAVAAAAIPDPVAGLSCVVVMVNDQVVHDLRGDAPLVPGYAQLLLTGHTAIEALGPEHIFETRVMAADPPSEDGTLGGNLYLLGSGDPVLMTYNYSRSFRPMRTTRTSIEGLADAVVAAGVESIAGSVVGIERRFDRERSLPGWPASYSEEGLVGPLSALQLDDGLIDRAAANGGVASVAEDPAARTAERFDDLLEARDVSISGLARSEFDGEELPAFVPIASIQSAPLSEIVFQTLAVNDAGSAELLLKELGVDFRQSGSTQSGADAVQFTLGQLGVDLAIAPRDGSGLDPVSTLTCNQLASVAAAIPTGHPTLDVLPRYDLPGVYEGAFSDIAIEADLRLVGGEVGDAGAFVARTVDDGAEIVIASIMNRRGGTLPIDTEHQRRLVKTVDVLREAWITPTIDN